MKRWASKQQKDARLSQFSGLVDVCLFSVNMFYDVVR